MALTGINHLAFITNDMTKTIRFYRDLLHLPLTTGIGHDGYRHYFFQFPDESTHVAFFEYTEASDMEKKFPGVRTSRPLGFDHVSFTVASREHLFALKDRLQAAKIEVHGAVDHGLFWSIYFYDPNNIPLEATWQFMDLLQTPAISDDDPMAIAAEGSGPQEGIWPQVTVVTGQEEMVASGGNGLPMRREFLEKKLATFKPGISAAFQQQMSRETG